MAGLIGKLLFKAMVPLVLMIGVMSYGVHLRGGDPLAILQGIGSGIGGRVMASAESAADDVRNGARDGAGAIGVLSAQGADGRSRVFSWQDADGVTHYSTEAPDQGATAVRTLSIDPDVNVLAPVRAPAPVVVSAVSPAPATPDRAAVERAQDPETVPLPGMGGLAAGAADKVSPEQAARLLKMLQGQ